MSAQLPDLAAARRHLFESVGSCYHRFDPSSLAYEGIVRWREGELGHLFYTNVGWFICRRHDASLILLSYQTDPRRQPAHYNWRQVSELELLAEMTKENPREREHKLPTDGQILGVIQSRGPRLSRHAGLRFTVSRIGVYRFKRGGRKWGIAVDIHFNIGGGMSEILPAFVYWNEPAQSWAIRYFITIPFDDVVEPVSELELLSHLTEAKKNGKGKKNPSGKKKTKWRLRARMVDPETALPMLRQEWKRRWPNRKEPDFRFACYSWNGKTIGTTFVSSAGGRWTVWRNAKNELMVGPDLSTRGTWEPLSDLELIALTVD